MLKTLKWNCLLLFLAAGYLFCSLSSAFAAAPSGTWLIDGTYEIKTGYKGKYLTDTDSFSGEKVVFGKKKIKINITQFLFNGKWKYNIKKDKITINLDGDDIEDMVKDYVEGEYSKYIKNFDLNIDVDKKAVAINVSPEGTLDGSEDIKAQCEISYEKFGVTIKVGTIDFKAKLNFTGLQSQ
ncbi:MAG: hypothetical protein HZA77_11660 [Candidatus Schekmanbacteria bacterium]|nr:hypothetical protein [Candidatus Schekmanbacteria bacterium]